MRHLLTGSSVDSGWKVGKISPTYATAFVSICAMRQLGSGNPFHPPAMLCPKYSTDSVVLETISGIETLTTELSSKISQKVSLLRHTPDPKETVASCK